jgi:hypothetical protein
VSAVDADREVVAAVRRGERIHIHPRQESEKAVFSSGRRRVPADRRPVFTVAGQGTADGVVLGAGLVTGAGRPAPASFVGGEMHRGSHLDRRHRSVVVGTVGYGLSIYNSLVALKNNIALGANIDVLLKQRHDSASW